MSDDFVSLLGPPVVVTEGTRHVLPHTRPVWFFSYLAFNADWVSRDELAYLFHPDAMEPVAKHYVRNLIHRARALPCGHLLETRREQCRLRVETDVGRFCESMARGRWEEAITIHQGPFLQGLEVRSAPGFENWLERQRDELDLAWHRACMMYVAQLEEGGLHAEATDVLEHLLHRDLLNEQALQAFLRNAALAGRRARALSVAERFRSELHAEFGIEPTETTLTLVAQIRNSEQMPRPSTSGSHRRRWNDRAAGSPDETEEIASLLKHPSRRLLAMLEPERFAAPMLLVAHRARDHESALCAIMDLAEVLMAEQHFRRATELLGLVAAKRPLNPDLTGRLESVLDELVRHVPKRYIDALLSD